MSLFNRYDSSRANTDIPITTTANTSIRLQTRSSSSSTSYSCQTYTVSGVTAYSIEKSYFGSGTNILLKMAVPAANNFKLYGLYFYQTGSGVNYHSTFKPTYFWRKGNYLYAQFINLSLNSSSGGLYPVYFNNSTSSGNYRYSNYLPIEIISAISLPAWNQIGLKIYDDGTEKQILPFVSYIDSIRNTNISATLTTGWGFESKHLQSAIWEVTPGNTYALKSNLPKNRIEMNSGILTLPLIQCPTSGLESYYTVPTPTTDPDTGEYVYTITIPAGKTSFRACKSLDYTGQATFKLYGQRTAGWYDVDDHYLDSNWRSTQDSLFIY